MRRFLILLTSVLLVGVAVADDSQLEKKKVGRPGELSQDEEDQLDKFLDKFVKYDIRADNRRPLTPDEKKIVGEFNSLGLEAIPALIRTLNKSAKQSYSCPVVTIRDKLKSLIRQSEDERVLDYMRYEIGAGLEPGVRRKYGLDELRLATVLRKKDLHDMRLAERASQSNSQASPQKPPGRTGEGPPK
jgi:hypothetical protein